MPRPNVFINSAGPYAKVLATAPIAFRASKDARPTGHGRAGRAIEEVRHGFE